MPVETNFETQEVATALPPPASDLAGDDERALIAGARNGSSAAIEELVRRYERRLFRLAQNITSNYEDAEEVVQNAFVKALRNLGSFRGESRFYTWLARIATNEALMKIRRRHFQQLPIDGRAEVEEPTVPREIEDWGPDPEQRYSQEELRRILTVTINKLDPGYRIVFQLRDIEGLSTDETARALGLSLAAVKSRLGRARLRLRNSLDVYFRPPHNQHNGALAFEE
jgi:RNA polymerase sigma-70 factor, ECF subfamily